MHWHAGLRGAMAFALCEMLNPETVPKRDMLITTTLVLGMISTGAIGASTPILLRALRIKVGDVETPADDLEARRRLAAASPKSALARWKRLDHRYLIPWLSNRYTLPGDAKGAEALGGAGTEPRAFYDWDEDDEDDDGGSSTFEKELALVINHATDPDRTLDLPNDYEDDSVANPGDKASPALPSYSASSPAPRLARSLRDAAAGSAAASVSQPLLGEALDRQSRFD